MQCRGEPVVVIPGAIVTGVVDVIAVGLMVQLGVLDEDTRKITVSYIIVSYIYCVLYLQIRRRRNGGSRWRESGCA
jgi:hypothetical protein